VMLARDGKEAVDIYQKNHDNIDMVILDVVMPEMGGSEAYDKMKGVNPGIKVLISSGYDQEGPAKQMLKRGCNGFIQKPFGLEQLSQSIPKKS
jgi:Response regulator containing CheY-like receiver, AAA-type ATPase, and DNA-binding domains